MESSHQISLFPCVLYYVASLSFFLSASLSIFKLLSQSYISKYILFPFLFPLSLLPSPFPDLLLLSLIPPTFSSLFTFHTSSCFSSILSPSLSTSLSSLFQFSFLSHFLLLPIQTSAVILFFSKEK